MPKPDDLDWLRQEPPGDAKWAETTAQLNREFLLNHQDDLERMKNKAKKGLQVAASKRRKTP